VLAIVLGVLVLVCSGVISYRWRQESAATGLGEAERMITAARQADVDNAGSWGAPYRQVGAHSAFRQGDDPMSEGRQTR
jgi:hypothetical protein